MVLQGSSERQAGCWLQVTPEGEYVPPPKENQKATYSTMLFVRSDIVAHAARYLAKAATIATRYCCVRRQTAPAPGARELQARRRCCLAPYFPTCRCIFLQCASHQHVQYSCLALIKKRDTRAWRSSPDQPNKLVHNPQGHDSAAPAADDRL
jgi:hypothetical protein